MIVSYGIDGERLRISINGPLFEDFGCAESVQAALGLYDDTVKRVDVELSSKGGDLSEGLGIRAALSEFKRNHAETETSIIVGSEALSAAALILCAEGWRVVAHRGATFMIHNASGFFFGNRKDIASFTNEMEIADKQIKDVLSIRIADEGIFERLDAFEDVWFDVAGAKKTGLIDDAVFGLAEPETDEPEKNEPETDDDKQDAHTRKVAAGSHVFRRIADDGAPVKPETPKLAPAPKVDTAAEIAAERRRQRELRNLATKTNNAALLAKIDAAFDDGAITPSEIMAELVASLPDARKRAQRVEIPGVNEIGEAPERATSNSYQNAQRAANALKH